MPFLILGISKVLGELLKHTVPGIYEILSAAADSKCLILCIDDKFLYKKDERLYFFFYEYVKISIRCIITTMFLLQGQK